MIIWLIGQPMSGKTTLAKMLKSTFSGSVHFDGDGLRTIFGNVYAPEHFTRKWREEQTKILQKLTAYIADQGTTVIVSTVNPYKNIREEFKHIRDDLIEVYVHKTDIRQRERFNVVDYEPPTDNFVDINTTDKNPIESYKELFNIISK